MRIKLFFPLLFLAACSSTPSVINESYNWSALKHLAVIPYSKNPAALQGIDTVFEKYLMKNGVSVVERDRLENILSEQKLTMEGIVSGQGQADPGVLGVDAVMIVQVLFFNPSKKEKADFLLTDRTEEPVYRKVTERGPDGKMTTRIQTTTRVKYSGKRKKEIIGEYSQISITARIVDIKNGEVIWTASSTGKGDSPLEASESAASDIAGYLGKDLKNHHKQEP